MSEPIELRVDAVVYPGKSLARHEGRVVFFHGALPGERVLVEVVVTHKNYLDGRLVRVVEESPARQVPVCPLAGECPGCRYQSVSYEEEVRIKHSQLADLLRKLGRVPNANLQPPVASPQALHYRNKITLHGWRDENQSLLGYFAEDNRTVFDVPECPLAMDPINACLAELRANDEVMGRTAGRGSLTIRQTPSDGVSWWTSVDEPSAGGPGRGWLQEQTPLGPIWVPRRSFFQVNPGVAAPLVTYVRQQVTDAKPEFVLDLYCGVGVFAKAAALAGCPDVAGVDSDPEGIRAAGENVRSENGGRVRFICGNVDDVLGHRFALPPGVRSTVILDPPRRGVGKPVIRWLGRERPDRLIYVSCAPDTMARDVALLLEAGYTYETGCMFDMFPRTSSFESVSVLRHAGG
jgi:23S rRNA (uracil1939-C5)-methyltransferase/tRNA (uracil-5-)-methyltransferase